MVELLEAVNRPKTLGFQADMAHTLLFMLGHNAPEDRLVPADFNWNDTAAFDAGYKQLTDALRPWTIDFHVAQNNGEVYGSGSHDKTGRHCLPNAPDGKLDIVKYAGYWLRDEDGKLTKTLQAHLLGRLHVPQRNADEAANVERHPRRNDRRPRRARLERINTSAQRSQSHRETNSSLCVLRVLCG